MKFSPTTLEGAYIIELEPYSDNRGFFVRSFCKEELKTIGFQSDIVQINQSVTNKKGAFRGFHFQKKPFSEIKIVRCLKGSVYDIIIDIRDNSPTFLQYFSVILTEDNYKMIYIPEGFAHGFQTLSNDCELLYLHSEFYTPESESGLNIHDPKLNIKLPLTISEISDRDNNHSYITNKFKGI